MVLLNYSPETELHKRRTSYQVHNPSSNKETYHACINKKLGVHVREIYEQCSTMTTSTIFKSKVNFNNLLLEESTSEP